MAIIAVASGKGGTGKSTVSVNLAIQLAKTKTVSLYDLDVEEPNDNIFLSLELQHLKDVTILKPVIDEEICTHCGKCAELCEFNALAVLTEYVMVFPELCHGCGLCTIACPVKAISETPHTNGIIESAMLKKDNLKEFSFYQGKINIGEAIASLVIKELKKIAQEDDHELIILDLPPGSACPVIEGLKDVDYVILVTEPTPAGEHDLIMAIDVVKELKLPFGIVINRADVGDDRIVKLAEKEGYEILLSLPHSEGVLQLYSEGKILIDNDSEMTELFKELSEKIREKVKK